MTAEERKQRRFEVQKAYRERKYGGSYGKPVPRPLMSFNHPLPASVVYQEDRP